MAAIEHHLKLLCDADGPSGYEDEVRRLIVAEAMRHTSKIEVDSLGNVFAEIKGAQSSPKLMIAAHMDEVGLMIRYVEDTGFLRFSTIGGIDPRILPAQRVKLKAKQNCVGVVGSKPPHILSPDEMKKPFEMSDLYVDIGASSREEVNRLDVDVGTVAVFDTPFKHTSIENVVVGKALDDRSGCTAALEIMNSLARDPPNSTVVFAFTVQEEVGLRGASVAANRINPDLALVLETSVAADSPDIMPRDRIASMGRGPVVRVLDSTMITQRPMLQFIKNTAERNSIPYQLHVSLTGGTDAGRIHISGSGVPTGVLSTPCRYLHGPSLMLNLTDLNHLAKLGDFIVRGINSSKIKYDQEIA
ncbi:MAG TPA: M42 family metallopeptidase [Candidatus Acidoferrales bacterium]|nr:M42 family metallopeptidase [Candidatus Acidoferrales bacterium]